MKDHPNIMMVYSEFVDRMDTNRLVNWDSTEAFEHTHFMVVPLLEFSLQDFIREREGQINIEQAPLFERGEIIAVVGGLASALTYLQDKNIAHRDLKPGWFDDK